MKRSIFRAFILVSSFLIILSSNAYASILIKSASDGDIFPAENGNMHILIRNDNSSYMYYSSGRVIKDVPLGVSDSSIFFETACSDGEGGVYVLYNYTENKTLYAQHFNSSGEAQWSSPGIMLGTYTHSIAFSTSALSLTGDFIVIYDNLISSYLPPYADYNGYLRVISPDGVVSSPAGTSEYYHGPDIEMHRSPNTLYIKRWASSYITPIFGDTLIVGDTLNSGILEFDCDACGFLYGLRNPEGSCDTLELNRFDDQLQALWEAPIVFDYGFGKRLSDPVYPRPEIMANNDGSVTLYPSIHYGDPTGVGVARIDSSGEYLFRELDLGRDYIGFTGSDGANLFLVSTTLSDGETDVVRFVKISDNGDIVFSTIIRYDKLWWEGRIIENSDGSYGTMVVYPDTVVIDKISSSGEILVGTKDISSPTYFSMSSAYPNPFNPSTQIDFELPEAGTIMIKIYDLLGHIVKKDNLRAQAGIANYIFNASQMPSGVYIIKAQINDQVDLQKIVLLK